MGEGLGNGLGDGNTIGGGGVGAGGGVGTGGGVRFNGSGAVIGGGGVIGSGAVCENTKVGVLATSVSTSAQIINTFLNFLINLIRFEPLSLFLESFVLIDPLHSWRFTLRVLVLRLQPFGQSLQELGFCSLAKESQKQQK